jgi:hypothetical protein
LHIPLIFFDLAILCQILAIYFNVRQYGRNNIKHVNSHSHKLPIIGGLFALFITSLAFGLPLGLEHVDKGATLNKFTKVIMEGATRLAGMPQPNIVSQMVTFEASLCMKALLVYLSACLYSN